MSRLVTSIEPVTGTKVKVFLDEEFAFVLYKGELLRCGVEEGKELSDEAYRHIMDEVLLKRGKERLGHMAAAADKTVYEARERLRRNGYPDEVIDRIIDFGLQYRFLDDRRYAETYLFSQRGKKSTAFLRRELLKRGISESLIDELMEDAVEDDEMEGILRHLKKRWDPSRTPTYEERQKLIAFLARKGFTIDHIRRALSLYLDSDSERE